MYGTGSLILQLSGQDHHYDQQVPLMCFIQCLWENLQVLLEIQNTLHPLQISMQHALSCSLPFFFFFLTVAQIQHRKWREAPSHCLAIWRIHRDESWASDRPSLTCLFASEGAVHLRTSVSEAIHLRTSTSVCGEQSCFVCVHLRANSVCLSDWAFLTTVVD